MDFTACILFPLFRAVCAEPAEAVPVYQTCTATYTPQASVPSGPVPMPYRMPYRMRKFLPGVQGEVEKGSGIVCADKAHTRTYTCTHTHTNTQAHTRTYTQSRVQESAYRRIMRRDV